MTRFGQAVGQLLTTADRNEAANDGGRTNWVRFEGAEYPAQPVAHGAACELFADRPLPGFLANPRLGARWPYRRFAHISEVETISRQGRPGGEHPTGAYPVIAQAGIPNPTQMPELVTIDATDEPMRAPVSRQFTWSVLHQLSQRPVDRATLGPDRRLAEVRASATIQRGTRMVKILSPAQLAGQVSGWLPHGFCYRAYDVAHLRTPKELAVLVGDSAEPGQAAFALHWRAIDPSDYQIPSAAQFPGLVAMPPHDRIGPPVIGTGFAPSDQHLIPEYVTADFTDLPLTATATVVAYTSDGTEVPLYNYLPEQRAWGRLFGPQFKHLLAGVPGISPNQEYLPASTTALTRLVGLRADQEHEYEAIADPPADFRVLARTRAARYPVSALARRTSMALWRQVPVTIVRDEGDWRRVRLVDPKLESLMATGARCVERGVYETWAPVDELVNGREVDHWYDLPPVR